MLSESLLINIASVSVIVAKSKSKPQNVANATWQGRRTNCGGLSSHKSGS